METDVEVPFAPGLGTLILILVPSSDRIRDRLRLSFARR
jgi:hypothetical protein